MVGLLNYFGSEIRQESLQRQQRCSPYGNKKVRVQDKV